MDEVRGADSSSDYDLRAEAGSGTPAAVPLDMQRSVALRRLVPDMVFILDSAGIYKGFSPGEGLQPFIPPELFMGRRIIEVLPLDPARQLMAAIEAALQTLDVQVVQYELWEGDTFRQYECRIVAAGSDEVVALVRDVSARGFHQRRQERWHQRELLEARCDRAVHGENLYSMSFREFTVLGLLQDGKDVREIARSLGLARTTVTQHVANI